MNHKTADVGSYFFGMRSRCRISNDKIPRVASSGKKRGRASERGEPLCSSLVCLSFKLSRHAMTVRQQMVVVELSREDGLFKRFSEITSALIETRGTVLQYSGTGSPCCSLNY
jgi:hypothetical protein